MLTPLNWLGATISGTPEPYLNAQIIVRKDEVIVSRGTNLLAQKSGAVDVSGGQRSRTITFADGTVWTATLSAPKSGCGCK